MVLSLEHDRCSPRLTFPGPVWLCQTVAGKPGGLVSPGAGPGELIAAAATQWRKEAAAKDSHVENSYVGFNFSSVSCGLLSEVVFHITM